MKPFRCLNPECAPRIGKTFDFWGDEPVCPKCKADERKDDDRGIIIPLEIIHFDPPHPKYAIMQRGQGVNACTGRIRGMRTGDPRQVNCPRCLGTDVLKKAAVEWDCMSDMPPEDAFTAFSRVAPEAARQYLETIQGD